MIKKQYKDQINQYPSLYDLFEPGERVRRKMKGEQGQTDVIEGIIMAMDSDQMEIYWDTLNGEYTPELIDEDFTLCSVDEVLNGNRECSPIEKKRRSIIDHFI
jgi:hypothetical protein